MLDPRVGIEPTLAMLLIVLRETIKPEGFNRFLNLYIYYTAIKE